MNSPEKKLLRKWLPVIVFAVLLYALVSNIGSVWVFVRKFIVLLNPLIAGLAIALVLNVPLRGTEKLLVKLDRKHRLSEKKLKILSFLIVLTLTPIVIAAIILFFVPQLTSAVANLYSTINNNSAEIEAFINRFLEEDQHFNFGAILDEIKNWFTGNIGTIAGATVNTAMSIFSSLTSALMSIMLAIYVLLDKKRIKHSASRLTFAFLPSRIAAYISKVANLFVSTFSTFLSRQCLESVILGVILFIGMSVFRLPYALSICSLTIVLALIPYVGAFMSFGIGAFMILLESPTDALIFCVMFLIIQQIEGNVIYPRVVGESVGLPAYLTLMAVTLGGAFMGMAGMMLFVPITSVIYTLLSEAMDKRLPEPFDERAAVRNALSDTNPPRE
ncbi:MAG: AI-2E family transporter [Clostridia bacterium]|nr:AI-2E family transporter [Clostridia bacterium]